MKTSQIQEGDSENMMLSSAFYVFHSNAQTIFLRDLTAEDLGVIPLTLR
jgi:hypothetical protein